MASQYSTGGNTNSTTNTTTAPAAFNPYSLYSMNPYFQVSFPTSMITQSGFLGRLKKIDMTVGKDWRPQLGSKV